MSKAPIRDVQSPISGAAHLGSDRSGIVMSSGNLDYYLIAAETRTDINKIRGPQLRSLSITSHPRERGNILDELRSLSDYSIARAVCKSGFGMSVGTLR